MRKWIDRLGPAVVSLVLWTILMVWGPGVLRAAVISWDAAFQVDPASTDPISEGDDRIRDLKEQIQRRLTIEHEFDNISPQVNESGRHTLGSARPFYQAAEPATMVELDVLATNALDSGRLWRDSDVGEETFKIHNGTSFTDAVRRWTESVIFDSTLSFGTNSWLCRSGVLNCFDPHEHGARHKDILTAVGAGEDYIELSINQILQASGSSGAPANGAFSCGTATTIASLTFNTSADRRGAGVSRALVIANGWSANDIDGGAVQTIGLCDGASNLGGVTVHQRQVGRVGGVTVTGLGWSTIYFWTGISNASHTVAVRVSDTVVNTSDATGSLVLIDLGIDD